LSNMVAASAKQEPFVAPVICPTFNVSKESDTYYTMANEEFADDAQQPRAPGDVAKEIEFDLSTATYTTQEYSLANFLPDRVRDNADPVIRKRLPFMRSNKVRGKLDLAWERRVKALIDTQAAVPGYYTTPSTKWDASSPTIVDDILTARESMGSKGFYPNVILIPPSVALPVALDATVRDYFKYQIGEKVLAQDFWTIFGQNFLGMRPLIPGATMNTANPGATESLARIWSTDTVSLLYVDPTPDVETATWARTMRAPLSGQRDYRVKVYRIEERDGDKLEIGVNQTEKQICARASYHLTSVLT